MNTIMPASAPHFAGVNRLVLTELDSAREISMKKALLRLFEARLKRCIKIAKLQTKPLATHTSIPHINIHVAHPTS